MILVVVIIDNVHTLKLNPLTYWSPHSHILRFNRKVLTNSQIAFELDGCSKISTRLKTVRRYEMVLNRSE